MSITNRQISAATSLLGLYTKQISEYTGISERQLSAYNTGKSNLSQDNINKLTQFFDNRGLVLRRRVVLIFARLKLSAYYPVRMVSVH